MGLVLGERITLKFIFKICDMWMRSELKWLKVRSSDGVL